MLGVFSMGEYLLHEREERDDVWLKRFDANVSKNLHGIVFD